MQELKKQLEIPVPGNKNNSMSNAALKVRREIVIYEDDGIRGPFVRINCSLIIF